MTKYRICIAVVLSQNQKIFEKYIETFRQPSPLIFWFCDKTTAMQIHANYVLNICAEKSWIFTMGQAGATYVIYRQPAEC